MPPNHRSQQVVSVRQDTDRLPARALVDSHATPRAFARTICAACSCQTASPLFIATGVLPRGKHNA